MTADEFVTKWTAADLSERAASQEHFIDLCRLIGQPTPAEADPAGENYCFEKSVKVVAAASKGSKGEGGFVDVWKRGRFGWEYKRKDKYKSLDEAYRQLYQYRDALDNPPLSVVCDIRTTEIRTHFTGYPTEKITVKLEEIPAKLEIFKRLFTNPDSFKPFKKSVEVTAELAKEFGDLADKLIARFPPNDLDLFQRAGDPVAHFLMKAMFCLFAEDIGLLPDNLFTKIINRCLFQPENWASICGDLFDKMKVGGWFGNDHVEFFNGGLFDGAPPIALNHAELNVLARAAGKNWAGVEPSIFGTLFERILDPKKRAQIGAHYTSKEDILLVVDPVVMTPLRRKWQAVQDGFAADLAAHDVEPDRKKRDLLATPIKVAIHDFRRHLYAQRVLDPACGSGNFLYVALQRLLDLEDDVVRFAARHDIYVDPTPNVRATQMHGIEINPYAAELAQVVIWIGYLQWTKTHGIDDAKRPILDKLEMIENRDAIIDESQKLSPRRAVWPNADFIIGNPPFLGAKLFRSSGMSDGYIDALQTSYEISKNSDLCCYWFEQGLYALRVNPFARIGLLATQGIRGADNRGVLERINATGSIFMAWSDRDWTLDGAAVHVSVIGFDSGLETDKSLDGRTVSRITADLDSDALASAVALRENSSIYCRSPEKGAKFEIDFAKARELFHSPNPNGKNSLEILRPWINAQTLVRYRPSDWIIDFNSEATEAGAAGYEAAFAVALAAVKSVRSSNRDERIKSKWWVFRRSGDGVRSAARRRDRLLVTPMVSKHRIFVWLSSSIQPDKTIPVFDRSDDYFFGVLQSSIHELWSLRMCTQLEDRPRYTPTTCFETFPLPWPPGKEVVAHPVYQRIAAAAKALDEKRERWLNPPEWIEPLAAKIDAADDFADVPAHARPLIRRSAIMAAAAKDARLKNRTLTKLYNERPTWLKLAHEQLDRAVLAAYAATDPASGWSQDWADVWVDAGAGQSLPIDHPLGGRRVEVDQAVLNALLVLNHTRAGDVKSTPPR